MQPKTINLFNQQVIIMTKHLTTRLLLVILACMIGTNGYSYDIAIKNAQGIDIYYNYVNNNKDLEVTFLSSENPSYSGDITIPEEITYLDKTYKVVYIGDFAFLESTIAY